MTSFSHSRDFVDLEHLDLAKVFKSKKLILNEKQLANAKEILGLYNFTEYELEQALIGLNQIISSKKYGLTFEQELNRRAGNKFKRKTGVRAKPLKALSET